jgi:hypothetical protein
MNPDSGAKTKTTKILKVAITIVVVDLIYLLLRHLTTRFL